MQSFECDKIFAGGAGMFIQYHDIVKPVYLFAMLKFLWSDNHYGLPYNILGDFSSLSLIEWYTARRYINPFQCLDYEHKLDKDVLDEFLQDYLSMDESIYSLSPPLNIYLMMNVYKSQKMKFPIYIYSEYEDKFIKNDIDKIFSGINALYVYGDLEKCLKKTTQNFTYIFSNIETLKSACNCLDGKFSHILLADDYRYNYNGSRKELKYNLNDLANEYGCFRMGLTRALQNKTLISGIAKCISNEEYGGE